MTTLTDTELVALDRFVSAIYWADDDITLADALDDWTATASAEHNNSEPFSTAGHDDPLAASLHELIAAVERLNATTRPGLTVTRALCEAFTDWDPQR